MVALFATFVLGQTKTEVKPANLPKCVTDYVMQNMKGFNIEKAFKMDNKGEITYIVTVIKGKEKHILNFDKNCKIVTQVTPAEQKKTQAIPPNTDPASKSPKPLPPVKAGEEKNADPKK